MTSASAKDAWRALSRRWYPGDSFRPNRHAARYYAVKFQVAERLRPRSICEIGVRAGYSAFMFLSASPGAEFLGIDSGLCDAEFGAKYLDHARLLLADFRGARLLVMGSQELTTLRGAGAFEFVHVDGDHTYGGCMHDLALAMEVARWVLVDDYDVGAEIRAACTDTLRGAAGWRAEHIPDGLRGNLLLTRTAP